MGDGDGVVVVARRRGLTVGEGDGVVVGDGVARRRGLTVGEGDGVVVGDGVARRRGLRVVVGARLRRGVIVFVPPMPVLRRRPVDRTGGVGGGVLRRTARRRWVVGVALRRGLGAEGADGARLLVVVGGAGGERRRRAVEVAVLRLRALSPMRLLAESRRSCSDSSSGSTSSVRSGCQKTKPDEDSWL